MREPGTVILDTSSGGPLTPPAEAAWAACGDAGWADPGAPTALGRRASDLLAASRSALADALGAPADLLVLAPSGGDAVTRGLLGLLEGVGATVGTPPRLVVSAVEHSAALRVARWWGSLGHPVVEVGVDSLGRVDREALIAAAGPTTVVCVQLANGEVGTDHGAEATLAALAERGAATLLDATAAVGRTLIPHGWSAAAGAATSWGGPRGVGVVAVPAGSQWRAPSPAVREEPVVGLVVAAAAGLEAALATRDADSGRAHAQVARIREVLPDLVPDIDLPGDPHRRLPHVLTVSALYCDGESLARALDRRGVGVGSGSACASDSGEPSHVLAAMGALTGGNVRLALPVGCPDEWVDRFLVAYPEAVAEVRESVGMP